MIIDCTGISTVGEGKWPAARNGQRERRRWRELHIGVDRRRKILTQVLTVSTGDEANTGLAIIKAIRGKLVCVSGDAANDARTTTLRLQRLPPEAPAALAPDSISAAVQR
ncbi:MAG: hypothetical protein ACI8QS_002604 [Planctomycetota bacterium]|jgi:hypothetical protein